MNNLRFRFVYFLAIILSSQSVVYSQENLELKKSKIKCLSGDCKNGEGLGILYLTYYDGYESIEVSRFVKGSFIDGKLNGFASIAKPNLPEYNHHKELQKVAKKLKKDTNTLSLADMDLPFTAGFIVEANFKNNFSEGTITMHEKGYSHRNKANAKFIFEKGIEVKNRISYGKLNREFADPIKLANLGTPFLKQTDSIHLIFDNGTYRVITPHQPFFKGEFRQVSTIYEYKSDTEEIHRVTDAMTGWDLVKRKENGKLYVHRELNVYFADESRNIEPGSLIFNFIEDSENYGTIKINDSTTYTGGRNIKGEPHGFGKLETLNPSKTKHFISNSSKDTTEVFKYYTTYDGYFFDGRKNGHGRELIHSTRTDFKTRITTKYNWYSAYFGNFKNDEYFENVGYLLIYSKIGKIKEWYLGRFRGINENGIYPYYGEKHRNIVNNFIPPFGDRSEGNFDNTGRLTSSARDYSKKKTIAMYCYPGHDVIIYDGKKVLVTGIDGSLVYLSDGNSIQLATPVIIDKNASAENYMCICSNCNGERTVVVSEYTKDVESYYQQGIKTGNVYRIVKVNEKVTSDNVRCTVCRGRGVVICK